MSLALTSQSPMATQKPPQLDVPALNAFDVSVASGGELFLTEGGGVITFRTDGAEITLYGFEEGTLPEVGAVVKIWGVSLERGRFLLPAARCTSRGSGNLKNSATFVQLVAPLAPEVGIPQSRALDVSVASESGLLFLEGGDGVIVFRHGGAEITLYGFEEGTLPEIGAVVKIRGISLEREPFFLITARCTSHGSGLPENSATFVQMHVDPSSK